jgi:DNA-binding NarL/FixJ family response regulator
MRKSRAAARPEKRSYLGFMPAPTPRAHPRPARKILLVDDHPVVREMLSLRIAQEQDLVVCGAEGDMAHALAAVERHRPDLAVLDINLPDGHGLELIKEIHARDPKIRLLVFSMHDENLYGERVLRAGAQGYLMKNESPDKIIDSIRRILDGKLAVSEELSHRLLSEATQRSRSKGPGMEQLSDRELEVFELIGQGLDTKEIAHRLKRGVKTIDTYCLRIKEKLKIGTMSELVARASRWVTENA